MICCESFQRIWAACHAATGLVFFYCGTTFGADLDPELRSGWPGDHREKLALAVRVFGNAAYVGAGGSLQVIDIADPTKPRWLAGYETGGTVHGIAVSGNHAFVAAAEGGLEVLDISNPTMPKRVGKFATSGEARAVEVVENLAYVAVNGGLQIVNITNPNDFRSVGTYESAGSANALAISDKHAFVVGDYSESTPDLQVFDISDPTKPVRIGTFGTGWEAGDVMVLGNYAYVAYRESLGLWVFDITDPAKPRRVGGHSTNGDAGNLAIAGHHVLAAAGLAGLQVFDLSDPARLNRVAIAPEGGFDQYSAAVTVSGQYAYAVANHYNGWFGIQGGSVLNVIDLSDLAKPRLVGTANASHEILDVAISGSYAFVADADAGLQVLDFSDPAKPKQIGGRRMPGHTHGVMLAGHHAYIADGEEGLQIIDVSNPFEPQEISRIDTPGFAESVTVSGNFAYVADGTGGLQIIDVSNPANLQALGRHDSNGYVWRAAVSSNRVFLAAGEAGLEVIDVANRNAPKLLAHIDGDGSVFDVAISDNYAYAVGSLFGKSGLLVIDTSNPTVPRLVANIGWSSNSGGLTIADDYAYVAWDGQGLWIVDLADPTHPQRAGFYPLPLIYEKAPNKIAVSGNIVVVADGRAGISIIDTSRTPNPRRAEVGQYERYASDVAVAGPYAYTTVNYRSDDAHPIVSALHVTDISTPVKPRRVGACEMDYQKVGAGSEVAVYGDHAYVATSGRFTGQIHTGMSLQVFDVADPANPRWIGACDLTAHLLGLAVTRDRAYARVNQINRHWLEVIDTSDPALPRRLASLYPGEWLYGLPTSSRFSYSPDEDQTWILSDRDEQGNPRLIGGYKAIALAMGLTVVSGKHAFVGGSPVLEIMEISDPRKPRRVGLYNSLRRTESFRVLGAIGSYVHCIAGGGWEIIDVSDVSNPRRVGGNENGGGAFCRTLHPRRSALLFAASRFKAMIVT